MKKILQAISLCLLGATMLRAAPSQAELLTRVASCEAILQEFMADPATAIPPAVWQRAHAIMIVNQFKAGFILGVKDGYGVVLVKQGEGKWSIPVLINASETSLGFQIGANSVESIYIITDDATPRMLFNRRFNVGVDAKAVAGPHLASREDYNHDILRTPILAYVKAKGLYVGATVKAGYLSRNDDANFTLYNTTYTLPELLYSDWVQPPPDVQNIIQLVAKYGP